MMLGARWEEAVVAAQQVLEAAIAMSSSKTCTILSTMELAVDMHCRDEWASPSTMQLGACWFAECMHQNRDFMVSWLLMLRALIW